MSYRKDQDKQRKKAKQRQHAVEQERRRHALEQASQRIDLNNGKFVDSKMMTYFGSLAGPFVVDLGVINDAVGGFDNRVAIHKTVEDRLLSDPRCQRVWNYVRERGEQPSYPQESFCFNVAAVSADAKNGRIPQPSNTEEWINALVEEHCKNCIAAERSGHLS